MKIVRDTGHTLALAALIVGAAVLPPRCVDAGLDTLHAGPAATNERLASPEAGNPESPCRTLDKPSAGGKF